jgi:hypothetical protein
MTPSNAKDDAVEAVTPALECLADDETFTPESVIALGCEALAKVRAAATPDPRYCGCDHVPCEHRPACSTPRCHSPAYCDGLCNECFHEWLHNGGSACADQGLRSVEVSEALDRLTVAFNSPWQANNEDWIDVRASDLLVILTAIFKARGEA